MWFYEKYINKLNWNNISRNKNIPIEFYEKHIEKLNWEYISRNTNIHISFYEKNLSKLDWLCISTNTNIPMWFYEKHIEKLDWYWISNNPNIPIWFYEKYINKFSIKSWPYISRNIGTYENNIKNKQTEVPESYKSTPEYLEAVRRIQEWVNNGNENVVLHLNKLKLKYLPPLPVNLQKLSVDDNNLTFLQPLPVNLTELYCGFNKLIYLPPLPKNLRILFCIDNDLTNLPVLPNTINYLYCENNYLTVLNLSKNHNINYIDCDIERIDGIVYIKNQKSIQSNELINDNTEEVPESYKSTPEYLEAVRRIHEWINNGNDNEALWLSELYLQHCPVIPSNCKKIYLNNNNLKHLPKLHNNLLILDFSNNQIKNIEQELPKNLNKLICSDNNLQKLDVSNLKNLQKLECMNNNLTNLKVNENLSELYCSYNNLTYLKFPKNLQKGNISKNNIKVLDSSFFDMEFDIDNDYINIEFGKVYVTTSQIKEIDILQELPNHHLTGNIMSVISDTEYNKLLSEAKNPVLQNIEVKNNNKITNSKPELKTNNWVDEFTKAETNNWTNEFLNTPSTNIESTSIKLTDLSNNKTVNITQNDLEYLDYAEFLKYCLNTTTVEHISKHLTNYNNSLTIKNKITKVDNSNEWRKNKGKKIIYSKTTPIKSKM